MIIQFFFLCTLTSQIMYVYKRITSSLFFKLYIIWDTVLVFLILDSFALLRVGPKVIGRDF